MISFLERANKQSPELGKKLEPVCDRKEFWMLWTNGPNTRLLVTLVRLMGLPFQKQTEIENPRFQLLLKYEDRVAQPDPENWASS